MTCRARLVEEKPARRARRHRRARRGRTRRRDRRPPARQGRRNGLRTEGSGRVVRCAQRPWRRPDGSDRPFPRPPTPPRCGASGGLAEGLRAGGTAGLHVRSTQRAVGVRLGSAADAEPEVVLDLDEQVGQSDRATASAGYRHHSCRKYTVRTRPEPPVLSHFVALDRAPDRLRGPERQYRAGDQQGRKTSRGSETGTIHPVRHSARFYLNSSATWKITGVQDRPLQVADTLRGIARQHAAAPAAASRQAAALDYATAIDLMRPAGPSAAAGAGRRPPRRRPAAGATPRSWRWRSARGCAAPRSPPWSGTTSRRRRAPGSCGSACGPRRRIVKIPVTPPEPKARVRRWTCGSCGSCWHSASDPHGRCIRCEAQVTREMPHAPEESCSVDGCPGGGVDAGDQGGQVIGVGGVFGSASYGATDTGARTARACLSCKCITSFRSPSAARTDHPTCARCAERVTDGCTGCDRNAVWKGGPKTADTANWQDAPVAYPTYHRW